MGAQGQLIATIDRFAWLCMIVLVLSAALVVLAMPEATMGLLPRPGDRHPLRNRPARSRPGRLRCWMLLLAGLTWLFLRIEHLAPRAANPHAPGPRRPPNGVIGTVAMLRGASADSLPKASRPNPGSARPSSSASSGCSCSSRWSTRSCSCSGSRSGSSASIRRKRAIRSARPAADRRLPFLGRNISSRNSSINVDSAALTWDNRGLIIYAVCDQDRPRPETDTNARTGGRAPVLHD